VGRDQGVCVVLDFKDGKALVAGPKVRKRAVNPLHLALLKQELPKEAKTEVAMLKALEGMQNDFEQAQADPVDLLVLKAKAGQRKQ